MAKILLLNGPNLNRLGHREPSLYGHESLETLCETLVDQAKSLGHALVHLQSNAESELIDAIQGAPEAQVKFIIINPGAFTHSSIALRDAFLGAGIAFIEVHISNIYARETFRHHSYLSDIANGVICGLGSQGYELALSAANKILQST